MVNELSALLPWLQDHRDEILSDWQLLVDTPSRVSNRQEGDQLCKKLHSMFESLGMKVVQEESGSNNAPTIIGLWGEDLPGKPVLFTGHYDTVDLVGENHFRIDEEGHVRGLGCLDMKGGIVIAIWTLRALQHFGWKDRPVKFLFAGDEETGHMGGCAAQTIRSEASDCLCAFNMETGLVSDQICVGRKGTTFATIKTTGVASHSGNDFKSGRNAVAEMALKIPKIQSLTDLEQGTSVSCNTIHGGTVTNGIPGSCEVTIDTRYLKISERERIHAALRSITAEIGIEGCSSELVFDERMPPFETSEGTLALASFLSDVAESIGRAPMGTVVLGGGSDAAHISAVGTPVVCSAGVRGQFNHTANEYALPESLLERTELYVNAMYHLSELEEKLS